MLHTHSGAWDGPGLQICSSDFVSHWLEYSEEEEVRAPQLLRFQEGEIRAPHQLLDFQFQKSCRAVLGAVANILLSFAAEICPVV